MNITDEPMSFDLGRGRYVGPTCHGSECCKSNLQDIADAQVTHPNTLSSSVIFSSTLALFNNLLSGKCDHEEISNVGAFCAGNYSNWFAACNKCFRRS